MESPRDSIKQIDSQPVFKQTNHKDPDSLFPLPRYFQIHFEHIHDNAGNLEKQLDDVRKQLHEVENKLDRLLGLLNRELTDMKA